MNAKSITMSAWRLNDATTLSARIGSYFFSIEKLHEFILKHNFVVVDVFEHKVAAQDTLLMRKFKIVKVKKLDFVGNFIG
jgi:hypothetical protein